MSDPASEIGRQDLARRAADAMWAGDRASQKLGMEITEIGPGSAVLTMTIQDDMVNGHGIAHGGYIFTLADSAFAFACNSYGQTTVAAHCSITYIRAAQKGDRLIARAREVSRAGRSGIYDITVSAGDQVVAEFRGHSRTIGASFPEPDGITRR